MNWLVRLLLYVPILFLVMIVYTGQRETTARATIPQAAKKTVKFTIYSVVLVVAMEVIEALFLP